MPVAGPVVFCVAFPSPERAITVVTGSAAQVLGNAEKMRKTRLEDSLESMALAGTNDSVRTMSWPYGAIG
jgi:hypothetical protein